MFGFKPFHPGDQKTFPQRGQTVSYPLRNDSIFYLKNFRHFKVALNSKQLVVLFENCYYLS